MDFMQTYIASTKRRSDLTDEDLVRQAHVGDQNAFEILVDRYSALLYLLISQLVHELRQRLLEAIETLPSRYRAVVLLRYTDQLSYREIGQALSMPESTAKTYFYRASKQLRSLLGSEFAYYEGRRGHERASSML